MFQFPDRTLYPQFTFCVHCYSVLSFLTAFYSVYGLNLYNSLNKTDYMYLKLAVLVMRLALQQKTHGLGCLNLCKGGNLFLQFIFCPWGQFL